MKHFGPDNQYEQGDVRMFENSNNFGIYGGTFINGQNTTIETHDQKWRKIGDWLKAPECSTNFNAAANKKTAGTGMWIIKHPKYIEWNNNGGLLWIQGKGGWS
ncbi:hypothetical protein BT96DRAFT_947807 [Gymnopus androsaceus JB14]|uniref:Uncharacterized protein n=1 Tax=Gymnopus androsaceus JB14 TaxID=1447944 RepID=A0A6A4GSQ6_9AGAR|nr:hypothetical protein BT96DRAFT_947807 [Gymnopus androsaceus JB14]